MRPTNDIAAPVNELHVHNKINIICLFALLSRHRHVTFETGTLLSNNAYHLPLFVYL